MKERKKKEIYSRVDKNKKNSETKAYGNLAGQNMIE